MKFFFQKFASEFSNVSAYRADIYTLMGVGRKKTAQFPRKMMFAGKILKNIIVLVRLNFIFQILARTKLLNNMKIYIP